MTKRFDWSVMSGLPDTGQEALKNYFLYAFQPGSFLTSLLSNDPWTEVIARADHWNKPVLGKYLEWLQEYAPEDAWGSREAVQSWIEKGPGYQRFQKSITWEILQQSEYDQDPGF